MDLDHLRSWIGREERASERLDPGLVRRFGTTFDREWSGEEGAEAPLLIHFCLAQPTVAMSGLGPDGHPALGGFLPPVPLPRRMWAGGAFEFVEPLRVGETVERVSRIASVEFKEGRTGPLCFVTVAHEVRSGGRLALTERQDIVYRGTGTAARPEPATAQEGAHRKIVSPSATLLFRYSALTFNGHRIHYDRSWASQEGYPGLVVHGPIQATFLVQMAADLAGRCPRWFSFRSVSAIFDDAEFSLNADPLPDGAMKLWTARAGGPVAMEARAEW